jgi:hypothetical protein
MWAVTTSAEGATQPCTWSRSCGLRTARNAVGKLRIAVYALRIQAGTSITRTFCGTGAAMRAAYSVTSCTSAMRGSSSTT